MKFNRLAAISLLSIATLTTFMPEMQPQASAPLSQRRDALNNLLDEQWQYTMRESPEFATVVGDYRYNDRWSDLSLAHITQQNEDAKRFLARFEAVDTSGFPEQEQLNKELMVRNLKDAIEGYKLKTFEMPVDQISGIQLQLAQFSAVAPFDSVKHYDDYIARLNAIPTLMDQIVEVMRQGEKDKLMPPRYLLQKTVVQCRSIGEPAGAKNAFAQPLTKFPATISAGDRKRLQDAMLAAVDDKVRPSYARLASFIETEYAPKGRTEVGIWSLPDGDALYRYAIRTQTTTDKSADEIHKLGLEQVAEIEQAQTALALKLGAKDLKSFRTSLKTNPKLIPTSREEILNLYRKYIAQMKPELPKLFGLLPKAQVEVVAVEQFREKEAPAAEYVPGTPDGSRPGKVYVNTGDYQHRSTINIESTAYHEGIPGHHMQLSIAQELPALPPFRQHGFYTAYTEGWALYSERLGKEVGFYQDPYSDFGRLNDELLRACRLVLDTGVHSKHWTREQMVEFFRDHSGEDEPDIQAETDRYIVSAGQALAYKLGQLKFIELRRRAKDQLGAQYDVRAFHDEMLNGGALPLNTLEVRTDQWIANTKAGKLVTENR
jgi:uncharacterized protein (DUF885 family)